jgi:hypothetical protein
MNWPAFVPVALLLAVASAQITLARTANLSPWKGGGFGMFSTTDDAGRRWVRVYVAAAERSEEIDIAPSLEDAARRAAVLPTEARLTTLARRVVDRERRYQRAIQSVRIETWRVKYSPATLAASGQLIRDFLYRVDTTAPSGR